MTDLNRVRRCGGPLPKTARLEGAARVACSNWALKRRSAAGQGRNWVLPPSARGDWPVSNSPADRGRRDGRRL